MKQLREQNTQEKSLDISFWTKNTLLNSENNKELAKDKKKGEDNIIIDVKNKTKKESRTNQRYKKPF